MNARIAPNRMAAWRAFLKAHATVIKALEREMEEEQGLLLAWYDILYQLNHAPEGRLRMQALAEAVVLSRSGLTRLVDRLEKAGLVRRESCPDDRRGHYASITNEGKLALERAMPGHLRSIQRHFMSHLTADDLRALHGALNKVLQARSELPGEGPTAP